MGKRIFLFIIGLSTLAIGALFTWIMAQSFLNAQATRAWEETPAMIKVAEVESRKIGEFVPVDYAPKVEFSYEYQGESYTSDLLTPRGKKWAKERKKAEAQLKGLSIEHDTTCWVNPDNPETAILKHDTKAAGYSIWFPLLFVIGGAGVMVGAFRRERENHGGTEDAESLSI